VARRGDLIRELSEDLRPARGLRSPRLLALVWGAGAWLFVIAATLWAAPMRPGFAQQLTASLHFAGETLLGFAAGALAVATAFALGVPGWGSPRRRAALALGALGLWVALHVYGLVDPALEPSMAGKRPHCFLEVLIYGAPVLVVGLVLLRRLAPLDRRRTGVVLGAAAGAMPGLLMQLACMYVPEHILTYHIAPAVALALLGGLLGPLFLRRI
jgi:hypothetical protein